VVRKLDEKSISLIMRRFLCEKVSFDRCRPCFWLLLSLLLDNRGGCGVVDEVLENKGRVKSIFFKMTC
jgi:hypothetical protein